MVVVRMLVLLVLCFLLNVALAGISLAASSQPRQLDQSDNKGDRESVALDSGQVCIRNQAIKSVRFSDNHTGVIELASGDKLRITLRNECHGIKFDGYVHKPVNNQFCEGDVLRVLRSGSVCEVEKLEPWSIAEETPLDGSGTAQDVP